ncbi:MAG: hypothetical protein CL607_09300 [Anaerolineaceae bacterium]|nr:hypothetical protein [Anaerolineaceae bacterium]
MSEDYVQDKATLLAHIERDWAYLNQFLHDLSKEQWLNVKNPDGWAVKDHIAHIEAWERSMIALLNGRPRHTGLKVDEALYVSGDFDAINHAIFLLHKNEPLDHVRAQFLATHEELMGLITRLSDADLQLPYSHYLPEEPGEDDGSPIFNRVYGNTAHHYREHLEWMQEQLDAHS